MHAQIVYFSLKDTTEEQYLKMCEEMAPTFGSMPGLLTKYWLADSASGIYGGVYLWKDREAMDAFMTSEVAETVVAHPNLANVKSNDFRILIDPTRVTRGIPPTSVR